MPELPEVEVVKRSLERKILNLIIKRVKIKDGKLRYKVDLTKDNLIIFPSYIRHKITKNRNKDPIVALSFQFQLL